MDDNELKKYIKKTISDSVKTLILPIFGRIVEDFSEMLKESEKRISDTNRMVERLARTCETCANLYESQISKAVEERKAVDGVNRELVSANRELLRELDEMRKSFNEVQTDYKERLESAVRHNRNIVSSLLRLAESKDGSSINSSVKIGEI